MPRVLLVGAAAVALLSGCATSYPPAAAAPARDHAADMMAMCPMGVPGTQVSAVDEVDGSTLTFTSHDGVAELRRRVHHMARMHNEHHVGGAPAGAGGGMMGGMMGSTKEMGSMMMMPPSHATTFDLGNGASIKLMPSHPADLRQLQTAARMHAQRMQERGCAMN